MDSSSAFAALDVAIGLVFVFLLLSLIASTVWEAWAKVRSLRSKNLEDGIRNLLADPNGPELAALVYAHPLIRTLGRSGEGERSRPDYIPSRTFAIALLDSIRQRTGSAPLTSGTHLFANARAWVESLPECEPRTALLAILASVKDDADVARDAIAQWFDDAMDRVSGWYRRRAQLGLFVIGLILAALLNVNIVAVASALWHEPQLRAAVVADATAFAKEKADQLQTRELREQLESLDLPIGWSAVLEKVKNEGTWTIIIRPAKWPEWPVLAQHAVGWLLAALAVSAGAPFWFNTLERVLRIRGAGPKPAPVREPGSA